MPKGQKERYTVGGKGTHGCKGYPVVGAGGKVHGCHTSRASARQQQAAIYASTGDTQKSESILNLLKRMFQEGDIVIGYLDGDSIYGTVEYVMEEGVFGSEGSEFSLTAEPGNPVVAVRKWEDGQETPYLVGFMSSDLELADQAKMDDEEDNEDNDNMDDVYKSDNEEEDKWDNVEKKCWVGYKQEGMKEKNGRMVPNCVPVSKSDDEEDLSKAEMSLKPTAGMKSAAARALAWKKEGKRGGTAVGLTRANQIVNGENLSESTVARMYSFFSRHEVDKKATGFNSGEEGFPSPGRVAWDLWGGDAGYSWSTTKWNQIKNTRKWAGTAFDLQKYQR